MRKLADDVNEAVTLAVVAIMISTAELDSDE